MRTAALGIAALWLATSFGCGGDYGGAAHGTVTLDGEPLTSGAVSFYPTGGGAAAVGAIDAAGRYELRTGAAVGLAPGDYQVTVVATEPSVQTDPYDTPMPGRLITPERYGRVETSELRASVAAGGNRIDLPLTRDP